MKKINNVIVQVSGTLERSSKYYINILDILNGLKKYEVDSDKIDLSQAKDVQACDSRDWLGLINRDFVYNVYVFSDYVIYEVQVKDNSDTFYLCFDSEFSFYKFFHNFPFDWGLTFQKEYNGIIFEVTPTFFNDCLDVFCVDSGENVFGIYARDDNQFDNQIYNKIQKDEIFG